MSIIFVAVYLLPKLYEINGIVPDYVNPDGTKGLIGDVIYYKEGAHRCGIEVKLGTVRLTKNEYNKWIVSDDNKYWPNIFLGVGANGLVLLPWAEFRDIYMRSVSTSVPNWAPRPIDRGYGPFKSVGALSAERDQSSYFPVRADTRAAGKEEMRFAKTLKRLMSVR